MATAPAFDGTQPCLKVDPDTFFPESPSTSSYKELAAYEDKVKIAKEVCATCAFMDPCLAYALRTPNTLGVWGGTSEEERKRIKRQISKQKHLAKKKSAP